MLCLKDQNTKPLKLNQISRHADPRTPHTPTWKPLKVTNLSRRPDRLNDCYHFHWKLTCLWWQQWCYYQQQWPRGLGPQELNNLELWKKSFPSSTTSCTNKWRTYKWIEVFKQTLPFTCNSSPRNTQYAHVLQTLGEKKKSPPPPHFFLVSFLLLENLL